VNHFVWPVRVYYEDTDSAGVVYYANYLKFMERARTEWMRSLGFEQDALARDVGIWFVVRSVNLHYRRPARFNDLLQVVSRIDEVKKASLLFEQTILGTGAGETLCSGHIRVACVAVDSFKPRSIPPLILAEVGHDH
jgi:acyl-CoA thioester hydrolase